jgi:hypothetical protein
MNRISRLFFVFILAAFATVRAQQMRSAIWTTDRFVLRYRTMLEPPRPGSPELKIGGGGSDDSTTNHRILTDTQQKKYFGYDLQVDPLAGGRFSLTFKPLTLTSENLHFFGIDNMWSQIPLPSYPASIQVNDGETIALDLLINPSSGQKIVEYITVSSPWKSSTIAASARDLQIDDVHMSLNSPRLNIKGKRWDWNGGDAHGEANGPILWIYVPDRGRFLLSFVHHDGYRKAGEVRDKNMTFSWNNETYEVQTQGKILPGGGPWTLYVNQDAGYRPESYPPAPYGAAAIPR